LKGVLLLTYGTPSSLDAVEAYYTHIRGGKRPTDAQLAELAGRYRAIGGSSPLIKITDSQRSKLQAKLQREGSSTRVYCGMKHSQPFISEVMSQAMRDGVSEMLGIPLTPSYSKMNTETYVLAVEMANNAQPSKMALDFVRSWNTNSILVEAWADRVKEAQAMLPSNNALVFSAHSLPERTLAEGDQYRSRLLETSELVASRAGREDWTFAFQSAGHTGEPWLGPDIVDHLQSLFDGGQRSFLVAPVGFVSDHLEVLYDIDVECKAWARGHGANLARCRMLNDTDEFIDCLYSLVEERGFVR
jgi:protoporphyrin/coproporphyrin ferrochelatase